MTSIDLYRTISPAATYGFSIAEGMKVATNYLMPSATSVPDKPGYDIRRG